MSVSFKKREFFKVTVTIPVPNEKGGFDDNTFVGHFKHTTHEEARALRERPDVEVVRDRLMGWDMEDADTKQPVPYTPEMLDALLSIASAPYHTAFAFYRAVGGNKAKN